MQEDQELKFEGKLIPYNYNRFITDCNLFNRIAGKDGIPTKQALIEQLELIREELQETIDDLAEDNWTGVLDGYADIGVTWAGFGNQLENLKFNTLGALEETAANNLTKFIPVTQEGVVQASLEKYQKEGVAVTVEYNEDTCFFVIKSLQNKVKKPAGFVSNDVSKFVPKGFKL